MKRFAWISLLAFAVLGCEGDVLLGTMEPEESHPGGDGGVETPGDDKEPGDSTEPGGDQNPGSSATCENECQASAHRCDEQGEYICGYFDDDPCTEWSEPTPCKTQCNGDICQCESECSTTDAFQCDGDIGYRFCQDDDGDGCLTWSTTTFCADGTVCDETTRGCKAAPVPPSCQDACTAGARECSGNGWRACSEKTADGCTAWSAVTDCGKDICTNGACEPNPDAWIPACSGSDCPQVVRDFSKVIAGNTKNGTNKITTYGGQCSDTNESGPEQSYVFKVDEPGVLVVGTTEPSGGDVDVHLLSSLTASGCLARGDKGLSLHVKAGIYYVNVDTYQSTSNAGSYNLKITFFPDSGKCGMEVTDITRINTPKVVTLPATGKVVQEAHMVTDHDQEENGKNWWPSTSNEKLAEHKAHSAEWTGVDYGGDWCPSGEGGCEYGQGATGKAIPWKAEAYYVCMYWNSASKPKPGTRFLVVNPQTGKAIVAAAGYETGPGDGSKIGGAVYEIHKKLGTSHDSTLTFGKLKSDAQSLEFGPIDCN